MPPCLRPNRLLAFLAMVLSIAHTAFAQVTITDLGVPPPFATGSGRSVNNLGQVVGTSNSLSGSPSQRATLWDGGPGVDLGSVCPTCRSIGNDINDLGEVVGQAFTITGQSRAFYWKNGVFTELPPLPGHVRASANAINNAGVIVGNSADSSANFRPVRWVNGIPEGLGILGVPPIGITTGDALDINDAGDIVGSSSIAGTNNALHGFLWHNGVMTALGATSVTGCNPRSVPNGINNSGQIVGFAFVQVGAGCETRPAMWINGTLQLLPTLTTAPAFGIASKINDHGDIVGVSNTMPVPKAVLWRGGSVTSLGSLGASGISNAFDINEGSLVAGFSDTPSGNHAVTFLAPPANTPPTLDLPASVAVDATSPVGAIVSFTATALDAEDGNFTAICSPASGSQFAIGETAVTCSATDSGGLDADGSFTVTVLGAAEQMQQLIAQLGSAGPGNSLQQKLQAGAGSQCSRLQAFINEVSAQSGKKLTAAHAAQLIAAAQRIRAVLGCS